VDISFNGWTNNSFNIVSVGKRRTRGGIAASLVKIE
jgi:hypothetical protein